MITQVHRILVIVCWLAAAALVVTNFRLATQKRQLESQIDAFFRSIELPTGGRVPPLVGVERGGDTLVIDSATDTDPVLVLVFSPTCPACDENWPNWDALIPATDRQGGTVVPVDITGAVQEDYLEAHELESLPVVQSLSPETAMAYGFRFTPQTLILERGRVAASWTGVLRPSDVEAAANILGVTYDQSSATEGGTREVPVRPACDGMPCDEQSDCGTRCTCQGASRTTLGTCVAKSERGKR
jgi:hypothetical protein